MVSFVAEHGGAAFPNLADLLSADIDAVFIATLPDSHAAYSIAALRSGKAVLCEKPSAPTKKELEAILQCAEATGMLWMEAMKPPFFPLFQQLKSHLAADPIGAVQFVRAGSSLANVRRTIRRSTSTTRAGHFWALVCTALSSPLIGLG